MYVWAAFACSCKAMNWFTKKITMKLPQSAGTIAAKFPDDFDYNLNVTVKRFNIKVGSRAAIPINSNRIKDSRVIRSYLENASRGDIIFVYNIEAQVKTETQVIESPEGVCMYW